MKKPTHLIINNPYAVPRKHWKYDAQRRQFDEVEGRWPAGYVIATPTLPQPLFYRASASKSRGFLKPSRSQINWTAMQVPLWGNESLDFSFPTPARLPLAFNFTGPIAVFVRLWEISPGGPPQARRPISNAVAALGSA